MPIIKSAKKKMRQDEKRRLKNLRTKKTYKEAVKEVREKPVVKKLQKAYSALDTAAKKRIIKKGKASRLKSRLSKLIEKKG
ncbi:30S ribosomal protein S20 [Candidatus Microgenomates bacterium]|nr:30S ribosomal protein S20 [Candidatus Microgenomates bacterium]